ncbi:MAG: hypothetical protein K6G10_08640 [Butyrivibrio sp.]|nr:hypothetical protein [Butyrivibrio sp.]
MKKCMAIMMAGVLAVLSVGCGEKFPELTDEEYAKTVEYAVGLLMKYSNNGQEKLIYVDKTEIERERKKALAEAEKALEEQANEALQNSQQQNPSRPETEEEEPDDSIASLAELDLDDTETETSEDNSEIDDITDTSVKDPNATYISADDTQEIIPDIFLSYQGYSVSSTYPESSKSYVVNSDKGKKLLVLRFDLYNGSDSSKEVNLIPHNLLFEILLNGKSIGYSSVTFLPNDLSSFVGTIDSRAHESVVVLTQIDEKEAKMIDTLGLVVTLDGEKQTVVLE